MSSISVIIRQYHLAEHETFVLVVTRLIVYLRLSLHFYGRPKIDNCVYQNLAGFQPPSLSCQKKVEIVFLLFVRLCLSTAFSFCLFSFLKRDSCEVTKPAEKLEVFLISPLGHTIPRLWPLFSFLPFFSSIYFPSFSSYLPWNT